MLVGAFFAVAVGAQGLQTSSIMVNPLDLSPNYSGMITGITGAISCCMGVLVPIIIGVLAPNVSHAKSSHLESSPLNVPLSSHFQSLQSEWRLVFWITFGAHIAKVTVFTIWGSAKVQPWNTPERPHEATVEFIEKGDREAQK